MDFRTRFFAFNGLFNTCKIDKQKPEHPGNELEAFEINAMRESDSSHGAKILYSHLQAKEGDE